MSDTEKRNTRGHGYDRSQDVYHPITLEFLSECLRTLDLRLPQDAMPTVLDVGAGRSNYLAELVSKTGCNVISVDPTIDVPSRNEMTQLVEEKFGPEPPETRMDFTVRPPEADGIGTIIEIGEKIQAVPRHLDQERFSVAHARRFLHYLPYEDADEFVSWLAKSLNPGARFYFTVNSLDGEYGEGYPARDKPLRERFALLAEDQRKKHNISAPVCLYREEDVSELMQKHGLEKQFLGPTHDFLGGRFNQVGRRSSSLSGVFYKPHTPETRAAKACREWSLGVRHMLYPREESGTIVYSDNDGPYAYVLSWDNAHCTLGKPERKKLIAGNGRLVEAGHPEFSILTMAL